MKCQNTISIVILIATIYTEVQYKLKYFQFKFQLASENGSSCMPENIDTILTKCIKIMIDAINNEVFKVHALPRLNQIMTDSTNDGACTKSMPNQD